LRRERDMLLEAERTQIIECCRKMTVDELTVGTSGNVSVRVGDLVAISPSGIDYDVLTPELIVVTDLEGNVVDGTKRPSTELPMHLLVYSQTDAQAVVHTHPVYSTAVGTICDETPAIHYMLSLHGGSVRVAPYAPFGSEELAHHVATAMKDRSAVLMQNHGAVCYGEDLHSAYNRALYLEWVCKVWIIASGVGNPHLLSPEQMEIVTGN